MAAYTLLCRIATSGTRSSSFPHATRSCFTSHSTTINTKTLLTPPFQARSYASSASIFDKDNQNKYYIFGGKGGVGQTRCAASLAVEFADRRHPTIVVSINTTHSRTLSDSFDQDLTDGAQLRGCRSPLYAIEITGKMKEDFGGSTSFKDHMNTRGLGKIVEEFGESTVAASFNSPHPGLDEAIIISHVMKVAESPEYSMYTRVVFDTSSKGDDLLHQYLSDSEISDQTMALSSWMETDELRETIERMRTARELIHGSTEYVIVTNPTVMGVEESSRLHASIKEKVLVRRLVVNEILPPSSMYCKNCSIKCEEEMRALEMIKKDPELGNLDLIKAPLVEGEIRGISDLRSMGIKLWNPSEAKLRFGSAF